MRLFLSGLITLLFLSAACSGEDAEQRLGAELIAPFKTQLKAALQEGLQDGVVTTIGVCKDQAPAIADSLSVDGVRMGRTSHRLRNPDNVAPAWVEGVLASYLEAEAEWRPRTLTLKDHQQGYVEPIVTQPLCVTCHGGNLAPDIASEIQRLYPEDEAVGFMPGELRGVFWVEYPTGFQAPSDEQEKNHGQ